MHFLVVVQSGALGPFQARPPHLYIPAVVITDLFLQPWSINLQTMRSFQMTLSVLCSINM